MQGQKVRTPFLENQGQVPLERIEFQATLKHGLVLCGDKSKKKVALTFDDGPSEYTSGLLKILKKHRVKATFFMLANQVIKRQSLARAVVRQGHLIGNHTFSHARASSHHNFSFKYLQVLKAKETIHKFVGVDTDLFRPAFGDITDAQLKLLSTLNYQSVAWSIDTQDWFYHDDPQRIANNALDYLHPGAVILMHDGGGNRSSTLQAVDTLIRKAKLSGYEFVTLKQLIS